MIRPWHKPLCLKSAIAVVVAAVMSAAPAGAQGGEEQSTKVVVTETLQMTGYRPAPVTVETRVLRMTGYRPDPVSVEARGLAMTGYRPDPVSVDTLALRMTGYRPGPVVLETDVLRMTGYRTEGATVDTGPLQMTGYGDDDRPRGSGPPPDPVAIDTDALRMTGYRIDPLTPDTDALRMTGYRPGPVSVDTDALQVTGYGDDQPRGREPPPEPVAIDTDGLRMTGYRTDPLTLDTDALRMTGYWRGPDSVDTDALQMTGYGDDQPRGRGPPPEPVVSGTDALRMTGYRADPLAQETDALRMTGYRPGPVSGTTDGLRMTGYRPDPATVDTAALRMTGYRPGPVSVDTDELRMTGYRADPATVDAAALRMTGYASRPGEATPADLEITKAAPVSCEAGTLCLFRFLIRNVGGAPFEGTLSVHDEPSGAIAGIGAVGPSAAGLKCLPTAAGPVQCLVPPTVLAPGATVEASVELRLSPDLRNGTRFENCVRLAPPAPGANTIRFVQFVLSVLGIDPGPIDGQSGPKTRAAVAAFQTERGLAATGEADTPTLRALAALAPADGNAQNDRACVSVGITKTITCGFGERVAGDACQPICTGPGAHWNGTQCVVCAGGTVWSRDGRRCVEPALACNPATTVQRGQECACAYRGMQRVSATDCGCPAGTSFVGGKGCVAAKPQCPFGKVYNTRTKVCDFICIPPASSTDRGCACPNGARYRMIGGCERRQPQQRSNPPPPRGNPPPLLPRLFQR